MKREELAVEKIKEAYGEVLAIYERGSALYELELTKSDYDLMVIIKTTVSECISLSLFAESKKIFVGEQEFDLLVMSEYRFFKSLKSCTLTHTEVLLKAPLFASKEFYESAGYLKEHAFELLTGYPVAFVGALYGYGKSYVPRGEITVGKFEGKGFAMMTKFSRLLEHVIEGTLTPEVLPELVTPKGEARERILEIKRKTELTTEEEVEEYKALKSSFEEQLAAVKGMIPALEGCEKSEVYKEYEKMLLAPII